MRYCKIIIVIITGVFLNLLSSCKQEKKEEVQESFSLTDKVLASTQMKEAKKEQLKNEIQFFGKITADNNKYIEVYPVVGGNVTKVFVQLGDYVEKGQVLATIKSTSVAGFQKEYDDAQNEVVVAKSNLKAAQEMYEGKLNTERDVLEAKSAYNKALAQLKRTQETNTIYQIHAGSIFEVRAPISGFITQKSINENTLLRDDKTDNIFDIAQINKVWAIANINESDIELVKVGEDAEITTLSYPDKKFYGKVDKIFNIINPETKAMSAQIVLDNPKFLLKPEMRANIKLSYKENEYMMAVPSNAVIFDKSKNFLMIFKSRTNIETRQVEVFRQVGDVTFISAGLNEREKVITNNQLLIYDALND
ncbi:efflux RND transporter periplasmic adaptor subunit [Flavobacterium columnare]|uniref:RND family efflux transporter MFP subunit n=1 Tax=Flavobacterium columnare (strain ATCC 49512 / CIP 103533 / TG 44/87) TaxID=1041826 RepID=G8X8U9_FLACA|nr:efflux RND transporter periplasmic adaptor subunit [Flavobacterium columnare]AEW87182.1 RND family efflux transporter MFP subunit [Flavobacterium columnare ATCC 49512]MBF6651321.1 efflux RND transporter periplasmic adaptor subunit [Flavobacterium columnare]MBF6654973.1 efflux RND transporter periplasmic adaptor subunit [Flavobacterium columnare]MBF6658199.1 efflux RND transporter periplasmic adaptor subunit [Flavobacterium columnare]PTD14613.1 efflux RND transporter periplasmic adaptor subu